MASTITVRALDSNGNVTWGSGQANYLTDRDAVAQIIRTRLLLFQGEWWESLKSGTPWFQSILGQSGAADTVAQIIQQRILGSPYVTAVSNVSVSVNRATRKLNYSCQVQTQFGTLIVTNQTGSNAAIAS